MELRLKQLEKTKAYRDRLSGLTENVFVQRKRVIIAPKMATVDERGGNLSCLPTVSAQRALKNGNETADSGCLNEKCSGEFNQYKAWIRERKQLRKDLNQCELVSDWLQSKPSLTEIEKRVQNSETIALNSAPSSRMKNRKPRPSNEAINFDSCDSTDLPVIVQPFPVALATINEYLAKKRLRFYDLFVQADRDKDWKVSGGEFKDAIKRIGIPVKDAEIDQFLLALDENNNDALEYKELAHGRDLFILNERMRKHLGEDNEGVNSPVASNPGQIPTQVSSQSLLSLPTVSTSSDHIFTAKEQDDEKHFKRQRKREKHRQKAKEKVPRQNCTMGGITGMLVDTFQRQKQHEYEQILKLCHLHGVPLSKNLLERVLVHPEDKALDFCVSSLKPSSRYLMSEKDLHRQLTPNNTESGIKRFPKNKQKISFYSYRVYPPAASVTPKSERMNLSSGQANISRKTDCWMTYEEYCNLTRHLDSRFEKSWKPSEDDSYWPSYVFDKVRLYLDRPRTQVRSANSVFDVVHNTTIH